MEIAITGYGIVSAIGCDSQSVLQSLCDNRTGVTAARYLRTEHKELPVGEVKLSNSEMKRLLSIPEDEVLSRTTLMGILAVQQALRHAHIGKEEASPLRVTLILGTTVGGMDVTEEYFASFDNGQGGARYFQGHDCGSCTDSVAKYFGKLFGDVCTVSTACSSAANAISLGARLIKDGQTDIVVAGGSEALSHFHLNGFNSLMILDHAPCRPFDATRAGLNLGEGAAFVVLEKEESAKRRGCPALAYLTGYGNACDAFHQTASSPDGEGAFRAMSEALHTAGLKAEEISYVNAHGTGTPNNDLCESAALRRIFGNKMPAVSSTKGLTGHATSAAGGLEAVICLLAMQEGFIPGSAGFHNADAGCITPTSGADKATLRHVMSNSFGFGGNDSSLIFSTVPAALPHEVNQVHADTEIREAARVEISTDEDLKAISRYIKPMEARRMGKLMKSSLLASLQALDEAGIETPDAVVTATAYGCTANSEKILRQMLSDGENAVSPTLFMLSTHNTIGGNIAIRTRCHGYNTTYTQGAHSLECALRDARMLLRSGQARNVLVGCHDELTLLLRDLLGEDAPFATDFRSTAILLTLCGK